MTSHVTLGRSHYPSELQFPHPENQGDCSFKQMMCDTFGTELGQETWWLSSPDLHLKEKRRPPLPDLAQHR